MQYVATFTVSEHQLDQTLLTDAAYRLLFDGMAHALCNKSDEVENDVKARCCREAMTTLQVSRVRDHQTDLIKAVKGHPDLRHALQTVFNTLQSCMALPNADKNRLQISKVIISNLMKSMPVGGPDAPDRDA